MGGAVGTSPAATRAWRQVHTRVRALRAQLRAAERSADGDLGAALAILERLEGALTAWLVANPDGDLEDDLRVLKGFKANLLQAGANPSPNTATAWDPWYED